MIEITVDQNSYEIFLTLTGHAFENNSPDANRSHGFYWAMRWLGRRVLGPQWMLWNSCVGGD